VDERVRARLSFVAGDMFADVPAADTYVVKTVMHDWDDASCVRMLKNCRARLAEGDVAASADSLWTELDELPKLEAFPARLECLRKQEPVEVAGTTHITCFPLLTDLDAVGVLEIESSADLDADQLRTVSSMLRVYRNVQGLLDYSERDMLTGLLNRKTFDDAFYKTCIATAEGQAPSEARREVRRGTRAYLGIIDIDHFKRVNDSHGHLMGDEVLLLLSRLMRACFRFHDRLYRFGGEEFLLRPKEIGLGNGSFDDLMTEVEEVLQIQSVAMNWPIGSGKEFQVPSFISKAGRIEVYFSFGSS
jgi:diguanylate cyclase (GGDEF)-like protein